MNARKNSIGRLRRETDGAVAIMAAVGLLVFLGMASLAIDMGQLYYARNAVAEFRRCRRLGRGRKFNQGCGRGVAERDAEAAQSGRHDGSPAPERSLPACPKWTPAPAMT